MRDYLHHTRRAILPLAVLSLAITATPLRADDEEIRSTALDPLKACQAETDPDRRLACFDAAVGAMVQAEAQGQLRIVDAETVKKARRSLFGFSIPDFGIFGGDDDGDEEEKFTTLETSVTSVRYLTPRAFTFRIEEGNALWEVPDAPRRLLTIKPGYKVVIEKGALGSYFIRFNDWPGVKGRRVE